MNILMPSIHITLLLASILISDECLLLCFDNVCLPLVRQIGQISLDLTGKTIVVCKVSAMSPKPKLWKAVWIRLWFEQGHMPTAPNVKWPTIRQGTSNHRPVSNRVIQYLSDWKPSQRARFMGPLWGPSGADRTQVGPMLAPWTLLSGMVL